jgi:hypothetical protein
MEESSGDVILVGQKEPNRTNITLDDFVVALKARLVHCEWPLVSIDPTPDTKISQMYHVRFEGGIQETAFGQALLEADYRLKEMNLGFASPGILGLTTLWDRWVESENDASGGENKINYRFWFYPINPHVVVREGVCVLRGLKVGVFAEVLAAIIGGNQIEDLKGCKDTVSDGWADDLSARFDDLCQTQSSFNRLRSLQELVGLSKALEILEEKPNLTFWLEKYLVEKVPHQDRLR